MQTPGEIRVSSGKTMTLEQAESMGIGPCIERMLNLTFQLRRAQVDKYEYMAMKVIVLLQAGKITSSKYLYISNICFPRFGEVYIYTCMVDHNSMFNPTIFMTKDGIESNVETECSYERFTQPRS